MINITDIEAARVRIAPWVRHTPVMPLAQLKTPLPGSPRVTLKFKCLQVTGSFRVRGAMNRLLTTPKDSIEKGIVTASGGNHGLAVARAAYVAGVPGIVYVPATVSAVKVAHMKAWNAQVEVIDGAWERANSLALEHAQRALVVPHESQTHPLTFATVMQLAGPRAQQRVRRGLRQAGRNENEAPAQ